MPRAATRGRRAKSPSADETPESDTSAHETADGCGYLTEASQRALQHQLARIAGHVTAISRMLGERACADDILLQVTAVKGGLTRFASTLVEEELRACMACVGARDSADPDQRVERLARVIATMLKQS